MNLLNKIHPLSLYMKLYYTFRFRSKIINNVVNPRR